MKKILIIVIGIIICVVIITQSKDENNTRSDYDYLHEIAWAEKETVLDKYNRQLSFFQRYIATYDHYLNDGAKHVPVIDNEWLQVISEAISVAVRQPQIDTLDDNIISLSVTTDKIVMLMNEISDYSFKVQNTEPDRVQLDQYNKKLLPLIDTFKLLFEQFKTEYKVVKDEKAKEDKLRYLAEERLIRGAQEDIAYESWKFYDLLDDYSNGNFNLREINYEEINKLYVTINNRISNYHKLLNHEDQVEKEVLSGDKSKQAMEEIVLVTKQLDYSMRQIVSYVERMQSKQGKQLSDSELNRSVREESKLLRDYMLYNAELVQAELNMNLNLRSYIVEE